MNTYSQEHKTEKSCFSLHRQTAERCLCMFYPASSPIEKNLHCFCTEAYGRQGLSAQYCLHYNGVGFSVSSAMVREPSVLVKGLSCRLKKIDQSRLTSGCYRWRLN